MTDAPLFTATFHSDSGKEWANDELLYIPRVGDRFYEYERAKGVFIVEEVWEVGEGNGVVEYGTHVFVKEVPMEGTKLYQLNPSYYGS